MNKTTSNLLFLAIGAIVGGTIGYISASNKKEIWLNDISKLATRLNNNIMGIKETQQEQEPNEIDTLENTEVK